MLGQLVGRGGWVLEFRGVEVVRGAGAAGAAGAWLWGGSVGGGGWGGGWGGLGYLGGIKSYSFKRARVVFWKMDLEG